MEGVEYLVLRLGRQMLDVLESQIYGVNTYSESKVEGDNMSLTLELPGVDGRDVEVYASKRGVRVVVEEEDGDVVYSKFFATEAINPKKADIKFVNGILDVRVPLHRGFFNR